MFVRIFVLFSLAFSIEFAKASDVYGVCYTSVGGTTSFLLKTENDKVNVQVFNHNGGAYAPFWGSLVVPNDLDILSKKAELIRKLDKGFSASWKTDQCKWLGDKKFICMGKTDKVTANNIEIEPWAVYSSIVKESSFAGDYEYLDMTISFDVEKESHQYRMRYSIDECKLSEEEL